MSKSFLTVLFEVVRGYGVKVSKNRGKVDDKVNKFSESFPNHSIVQFYDPNCIE